VRILVLHSRYLSGSLSGENRVVDDEIDILRRGGHDVQLLSPSADRLSAPALAGRSLASIGVARAVRDRVLSEGIDVVHAHNLYPTLGARVLHAAGEAGAGVLLTLHNYRSLCLAATFYRDGHVCEDCLGRSTLPGVVHACYRGSRTQSAVLATSIAVARGARTLSSVDLFLAVSDFVRAKHVEAGFPPERIVVKRHAVPESRRRKGPGRYFLVLSRLSSEKGVAELVGAWSAGLGELRIVGDGPERAAIEGLARGRDVVIKGAVPPEEVPALLAGARALLVPSVCYETSSRVAIEAYAAGVPVIASRIGGLPEIVAEGETGVTVPPGDEDGWLGAVGLLSDDDVSLRFGEAAHARWRSDFSPERGLTQLEAAYRAAIEDRARRSAA
jgi:glycosyltransferase involved in cell wall biosynthesis